MEFLVAVEGLSREAAWWHTPISTAIRLHMAYLERHGHAQEWAGSRMDEIARRLDALEKESDGTES